MSLEDNKAVVRRYVAEVLNAGNLAVVDDLFDEHIVYHEGGRRIDGREAFKQGLAVKCSENWH